jgi:alkylhydroperoxidase family enzyme
MAGHTALARQLGYTEQELADLERHAQSEAYDLALKAALRFAELMTKDAHRVTEEVFAEMRRHYDDSEILEISCVVGLTNYWNRFTTALRIDLSGTDEPYDSPASR